MKILFILKYIGKSCLIAISVMSLAHTAGMVEGIHPIICCMASAYCIGSIGYQFELREQKRAKKNVRTV